MNNHFFNFFLEASKGLVPNHRAINVQGQNSDIDQSTLPETVWFGGLYEFLKYDPTEPLNGATTLSISSSSTADASGSTGAKHLFVEGLDKDWKVISETIVLNGLTTVDSTNSYLRINDAYVSSAGVGGENAGVITIKNKSDAGHTMGVIRTGEGRLRQTIYSVPDNHTAYVLEFEGTMWRTSSSGTNASLELVVRDALEKDTGFLGTGHSRLLKHRLTLQDDGNRIYSKLFALPIKVPQRSDVLVECSYVSANNTSVNASLAIILVNDGE